jgi:hypothetical protein
VVARAWRDSIGLDVTLVVAAGPRESGREVNREATVPCTSKYFLMTGVKGAIKLNYVSAMDVTGRSFGDQPFHAIR